MRWNSTTKPLACDGDKEGFVLIEDGSDTVDMQFHFNVKDGTKWVRVRDLKAYLNGTSYEFKVDVYSFMVGLIAGSVAIGGWVLFAWMLRG